jgi:nucleoside-diphosphate-sugar epimerase
MGTAIMRIAIMGASGFIGAHLARTAVARGDAVMALSRSGRQVDARATMLRWRFGDPLPPEALGGDCAFHLAHDFDGPEGAQRTIDATLRAAEQLRSSGTRRQIYISSYSAGAHATSLYGRTKSAIEKAFAASSDTVSVRPGLVIGDGGIYGRIRKWAQKLPIIPLPDGGRGCVPVIDVGDLCERLLQLANMSEPPKVETICEPDLKSLRQLVLEAAARAGKRPSILPVPSRVLIAGLTVAKALRIPLPVTPDNLLGFIANQNIKHQPA